jgi:hypothetical protein
MQHGYVSRIARVAHGCYVEMARSTGPFLSCTLSSRRLLHHTHTHTGEIVFFVASRGHHADVGGIAPGSMPPLSKRLAEEGAAIIAFKVGGVSWGVVCGVWRRMCLPYNLHRG